MTFPLGSANSYLQQLKKDRFHKSHHLGYDSTEPNVTNKPGIGGQALPNSDSSKYPHNTLQAFTATLSSGKPQWVALDKIILRFFSYSHEGCIESHPEEVLRIRYFEIYFYLEDETVMIIEKRDDRAEMEQGKILNRQRVPRLGDPESHLSLHDFNVNKPITIYGRQHFIYKCDQFTRDSLAKMGIEVPTDSEAPFSQHLVDSAAEKHLHHRLRRHINTNHHMERFLTFDTNVLRFYAYWDDRERLFGDRHFLVIHYYLADQTTEILRKVTLAYGKEKLEPFIKRCKLPKNPDSVGKVSFGAPWPVLNVMYSKTKHAQNSRILFDQAQFNKEPEIFTDPDFRCGITVNILARPVVFYDCDDYTKWYYKQTYGYDMQPVKVDILPGKKVDMKPSPYNFYGTEEDSLRNCPMLVPKPPQLDIRKYLMLDWNEEDPEKLMFRLRMISPVKENNDRTFIMTYHMNEESIYIYERNVPAGVIPGSFQRKKPVKKSNDPLTDLPGYLKPEDLYVGGVFQFNEHTFVITEVDECTAKFMEKHCSQFPFADYKLVLRKFWNILTAKSCVTEETTSEFSSLDPNVCRVVDWKSFINIVTKVAKSSLVPHEYLTLARHFQTHNEINKEPLKQLYRSLIQHVFRRHSWEPSTNLQRALIRADHEETGYLSRENFVRCVKAVQTPINYTILDMYLDVTKDCSFNGIDYNTVINDWDWIKNSAKKLQDVPQNVGQDFDYNKFFGKSAPVILFHKFLDDLKGLV